MDDAIPREEYTSPPAAARPWYERPWLVGLLGLALMVGGWRLSEHKPPPADEQVREHAAAVPAAGAAGVLRRAAGVRVRGGEDGVGARE
jgi:hypothetical protein